MFTRKQVFRLEVTRDIGIFIWYLFIFIYAILSVLILEVYGWSFDFYLLVILFLPMLVSSWGLNMAWKHYVTRKFHLEKYTDFSEMVWRQGRLIEYLESLHGKQLKKAYKKAMVDIFLFSILMFALVLFIIIETKRMNVNPIFEYFLIGTSILFSGFLRKYLIMLEWKACSYSEFVRFKQELALMKGKNFAPGADTYN